MSLMLNNVNRYAKGAQVKTHYGIDIQTAFPHVKLRDKKVVG